MRLKRKNELGFVIVEHGSPDKIPDSRIFSSVLRCASVFVLALGGAHLRFLPSLLFFSVLQLGGNGV